ncbi:hybrid sensor histidine kinase/response regulator transcription factor [Mucilaginibacter segetis]|uniref:histidine kinase n=1 Tax=Mucilaginibacter segetis TaxID=2793071 RepID=A0A934PSW6_9SPHI|nr:hybrid sensor histidine kinase/response regulator transcription factor [Mucilaginibacter segetis]MBK0380208.1 response regulator [Mucilaginibacter segetis]
MLKKYLYIFCIVIAPYAVFAQIDNYNIYNYSTDNGLPTNDYQYIYQDSFGFLWLASYDGLFRWDGNTFKKYYHDEKDPHSLDHNIVYSIFEDSQRHLWIGTIGGLNLYNRPADNFIKCDIRLPGENIPVNAIVEDSKRQLWLGTSNGLCCYNHNDRLHTWYSEKNSEDVIFCLAIDKKDNIWAGTFNGITRRFSPTSKNFKTVNVHAESNRTTANKVKSLLVDHEGRVWIGTSENGIDVLSAQGNFINHYDISGSKSSSIQSSINCMYEDKNHTIWIGAGREHVYYINKNISVPKVLNNTILNYNQNRFLGVTSITEDSFGNLWFATAGNGLFYTNHNKNIFGNYLQDPDVVKRIGSNMVTSFYEDVRGVIWIGTNGGGLLKFDPDNKKTVSYNTVNSSISSNAVNDIKGDKYGNLWLATWGGGIIKFDPASQSFKIYKHDDANKNSIIYNDAKAILPDDSLLWIGTHGQGVAVYNQVTHKFIDYRNNHSIPFKLGEPAWINHLFKDSKKRLWIGTYSGLYMFDGARLVHFQHTLQNNTISGNSVNMVTEDSAGNIWVVSESGGLDKYNEKQKNFTRCTAAYGLPLTMKGIIADKNNTLWISSNEGLIFLDPLNHNVKRYGEAEGLQGNTFFHKAVLRTRNGRLYFGGPKGFNVFNPDSLKPIKIPSYFYFTDLYIYNEVQLARVKDSPLTNVLAFTDEIKLKPDQSFFSIEFSAINLYASSKVKYAYKLEGLHDQWINLNNERKVSFTNLDPGHYTLQIRYTNGNGKWLIAGKKLTIIILPPWWQTWWFRLLLVISFTGVIITIFYLRISSIKKRNHTLKTEVEKRTHELSEANMLLTDRNEKIKHQKEILEDFNAELLKKSRQILDQQKHIYAQKITLEDTVTELSKLNTAKDHFFSILAHDLKNPISAITGLSDFLKNNIQKLKATDTHTYLNSIHKSSNAIYDLLINLLNWSRTQSKNIDHVAVEVNVKELVCKNAALLEQQFNNKHIKLNISIDSHHRIYADLNMFDTVIRNLMSNSIKFTDFNGEVSLSTVRENESIVLCVADNGVGMNAEQVKGLFKIDKSNTSKGTAGEKGTGLGLVVSQQFININGGSMRVESIAGTGSKFFVTLPEFYRSFDKSAVSNRDAVVPKIRPQLDYWENLSEDKLINFKGQRILIIDDNKELRIYLRLLLADVFEVHEAENGSGGLLLATQIQPAVIITDLMMPVMDGIEFCTELKSDNNICHIPVVLLTSQAEENTQLNVYEAGADVYLSKPVKKELLIQVILNVIQSRERISHVLREHLLDRQPLPSCSNLNKLDQDFLQKLIKVILVNLADPEVDARFISEKMAISRTVLYAKVKTLTNQSVHELIKTIRLKKSLVYLLEGNLTISQVAYEVGFNSHSYFDKCFIKQYGMGPKEYVNKRKPATQAH